MNTEFKNEIKAIKDQLRGITLQVCDSFSATPYRTLRAFGEAILKHESEGLNVEVCRVWVENDVMQINSIADLTTILKTGKVTGVGFRAKAPRAKSFGEYVQSFGSLD